MTVDLEALRAQIENVIGSIRGSDDPIDVRYIRLRNAVFGLKAVYEGPESKVDPGYIVPVLPVADPAVVDELRGALDILGDLDTVDIPAPAMSRMRAFVDSLDAIRATPEPERAGETA